MTSDKMVTMRPSGKTNCRHGCAFSWALRFALWLLVSVQVPVALLAGPSSPRSVAMGGAYIGLASGVDAGRHNPANLGLMDYRRTGLELVGIGANIDNNSFTLGDYNKYSGAVLTSQDKDYILSRIPRGGLELSADAECSALAFTTRNIGFTVAAVGLADINLSKDIFELILNGNTYADTIDVDGSYSEAVSYLSFGLSYGMPVYSAGTRQLSVGATVKYLRGLAIEEVTELQGLAATYEDGFQGSGDAVIRTAEGGTGFALDLGVAIQFNDDYTAGARIENILSHLTWNRDAEEHRYLFEFDTMTVVNMNEDYVVSEEYSTPLGSFSTSLPAVMVIGFAKRSGDFRWAIDWQQGFRQAAGTSTTPRLSLGAETYATDFLPVRIGFTAGGAERTAFSFGSGLHFSTFYLDWAYVTGTSLPGYSSKGINLAIATGLEF
jgi:hypothetical protein